MICTCIEYIVTNVVFKIITVQTPEFGLNSGKETEDNPCSALKKNNKKKNTPTDFSACRCVKYNHIYESFAI